MVVRIVLAIAIALVSKMSFSRELKKGEQLSLFGLKQTLQVKTYMQNKLDTTAMDIMTFIRFQTLKRSCIALDLKLKQIERADQLKDQSSQLSLLYRACSEGTLSLAYLYQQQNP